MSSLDSSFFHPLVILTDDSISFVQGIGVINATFSLSLSFVLYVLKFSFNLLSISRITKSLNYSVTFSHELCISRTWNKEKNWHRHEHSGLYYLDLDSKLVGCSSSILCFWSAFLVRTSIFTSFETFSSWVKSCYVFILWVISTE